MGLQSSRLPGTFESVSILNVLMIFRAREMLAYFTNESCAAFFEADLPRLRLVLVRVATALGQYLLASLAARFLGDMVRLFFYLSNLTLVNCRVASRFDGGSRAWAIAAAAATIARIAAATTTTTMRITAMATADGGDGDDGDGDARATTPATTTTRRLRHTHYGLFFLPTQIYIFSNRNGDDSG